MLYRAPIQYVKSGKISKQRSYLAVVMRHYPRFTPKTLIDEYIPALAPDPALFKEFKSAEKIAGNHNEAFLAMNYQMKFNLSDSGLLELERLSRLADSKTVYLICQCSFEQRCHTDLLLLTAKLFFHAQVSEIPHRYPEYESRLASMIR